MTNVSKYMVSGFQMKVADLVKFDEEAKKANLSRGRYAKAVCVAYIRSIDLDIAIKEVQDSKGNWGH